MLGLCPDYHVFKLEKLKITYKVKNINRRNKVSYFVPYLIDSNSCGNSYANCTINKLPY